MPSRPFVSSLIISRALIALVLLVNLLCAFQFLISPSNFQRSFELAGLSGEAVLRGIGVLFVMWNVPYISAFIHPVRNRVSLFEAVVMQACGLTGEVLILFTLPTHSGLLTGSLQRFIYFDGAGLILLLVASFLSSRSPA